MSTLLSEDFAMFFPCFKFTFLFFKSLLDVFHCTTLEAKYARSKINENGQLLLEFSKLHNLCLTNTYFKHKPSHQTTWQSPIRITEHMDSKSQQPRRNPYRNQIDYILVRNNKNTTVFDSRSYGGLATSSDHKPVIADILVKWKFTQKAVSQHQD